MAILNLFSHRNVKDNSESADKIPFLVAVKHDRMHHTHGRLTGVKIEANVKGQPLSARSRSFVHALEFHDCSYRSSLFNGDCAYGADELFAGPNLSLRYVGFSTDK